MAQTQRQPGNPGFTGHHVPGTAIQPGGMDADEHLIAGGTWQVELGPLEHTGVSVRSMDDGAHARWVAMRGTFGEIHQGHSIKREQRNGFSYSVRTICCARLHLTL
jgi:hypothetical protein